MHQTAEHHATFTPEALHALHQTRDPELTQRDLLFLRLAGRAIPRRSPTLWMRTRTALP